MSLLEEQFSELSYYTLSHTDPSFIHQHIVDAFTAQTADKDTKPIKIIFALSGLYLYLEKGFTGKQVQAMHIKMAKNKVDWPVIQLPRQRGEITVASVVEEEQGIKRDEMIHQWCISVWNAYKESHQTTINLLQKYLNS